MSSMFLCWICKAINKKNCRKMPIIAEPLLENRKCNFFGVSGVLSVLSRPPTSSSHALSSLPPALGRVAMFFITKCLSLQIKGGRQLKWGWYPYYHASGLVAVWKSRLMKMTEEKEAKGKKRRICLPFSLSYSRNFWNCRTHRLAAGSNPIQGTAPIVSFPISIVIKLQSVW